MVLPAVLAAVVIPAKGLAGMAASSAAATVAALALASIEAALWERWRGSQDLVFADLMLWNCVRRWRAERRLADLRKSYDSALQTGSPVRIELLEGLSRLLAARSAHTHGHCQRVARHAERIARSLGLPDAEIARIRTAAVVHDLGKIYTPPEILDKPGPLTGAEFEIMKRHSSDGADLLEPVKDPDLAAIVRHHHERFDGSGYPDGLVGANIPLGARIVAVADTFDALTSSRPYRPAYSQKKGLDILAVEAGSQLDELAVEAFMERYHPRRSVAALSFLTAASARALGALGLASGGLSAGGASLGQLAPALGAAGLLALAPAIHQPAGPARGHNRALTLARVERRTPAARAVTQTVTTRRPPAEARSSAGRRRGSKQGLTSPLAPPSGGRTRSNRGLSPAKRGAGANSQPSGSSAPTLTSSAPPAASSTASTATQSTPPSSPPPQEPPSSSKEESASLPVSVPEVSVPSTEVSVKAGEGSVSAKL